MHRMKWKVKKAKQSFTTFDLVHDFFLSYQSKDNRKEDVSTYLRYSYFGCLSCLAFAVAYHVQTWMRCASAALSKREEAT